MRATAASPVASRMPTPLGSLRAAQQLAMVRHDLHRLSSRGASPHDSLSASPFGGEGSDATPSTATPSSKHHAGGGANGRWPLPAPEEQVDSRPAGKRRFFARTPMPRAPPSSSPEDSEAGGEAASKPAGKPRRFALGTAASRAKGPN